MEDFCNCVDKIWGGGGESEKSNKLGDITVAKIIELDYYGEEVEGAVLGYGCDQVIIMSVFLPVSQLASCQLVIFFLLVLLLNLLILPLPISLGARHIQEYFKNKRERKQKFINTQ